MLSFKSTHLYTGDFMKKVLTLPVCTRDRKIVSIERMSTFYMKSAVYTYIEGTNHQKEISIEKSGKPKQGGILFFNGGSFSTSWMWKMSPGKLPGLISPKHELFLKSNRKSITFLKSRDVKIESGCGK